MTLYLKHRVMENDQDEEKAPIFPGCKQAHRLRARCSILNCNAPFQ